MALKWGIASAGRISHDFACALGSEPKDEHIIIAVGARKINDAKNFADLHKIKKAYGSYEELAKDKEVQVVYIGTINETHLSVAKLMLENGKHLLVEKPLGINSKQVNQIQELAKDKNLFLMEALWSRFLPSYQFVIKQIQDGVIGHVKHVFSSFGFRIDDPTKKQLSFMDIGIYCININEMVFDGEKPEKISAIGHLDCNGIDFNVNASLLFKNGKSATFTTHSQASLPSEAIIVGQKGFIKICYPFWCPTIIYVNDVKYEFPLPDTVHPCNYPNSSALRYEAIEVRKCIKQNKIQSEIMSHQDSRLFIEISDEIRKQIGVKYDVDE